MLAHYVRGKGKLVSKFFRGLRLGGNPGFSERPSTRKEKQEARHYLSATLTGPIH
jgi:hypothetical protein